MSSPYGQATVILGFTGSGRLAMNEQDLIALLAEVDIEYVVRTARGPAEAGNLAREAVEGGSGYLICVGDDWTLHEVVNGIMNEQGPLNPDLVLAVLPTAGEGSDFLRTMGLSAEPADCVYLLDSEAFFGIDVGRITWGPDVPGYRYFINMAQAGMGGEMARRRASLPRSLGRMGDLLAFWLTLGRFKVPKGTVRIDRRSYGGPVANLVVANGQFYRNGVRMAMKAHPGDGKFDVLIQKGTKRDFVETLTLSLKAGHLPSRNIKEYLSANVEISADIPLAVEADGKMLGYTPALFEIVPQAFRLKI